MEFEIGTNVRFTYSNREYSGKVIGYDCIHIPRHDNSGLSDLVPCYVVAGNNINYLVSERFEIRRILEPNDIEYYFKGEM